MSARPTPEQARAYAEALIAWSEGKKAQCFPPYGCWRQFYGEKLELGFEYRILPDPPKAREWWMNVYRGGFRNAHSSKAAAENMAGSSRLECVHVREILDTEIVVDKAEYEELRRNEAALKATVYDNNQRLPKGDIFARAKLFGAKL